MDLLFKRYASPFLLLDGVIAQGQFCDFLDSLEEQKQEEELWEFYIHKLPSWDDRTYDQFKKELKVGKPNRKTKRPSDEQLETITRHSYELMKDFTIEEQEGG